MGKCLKRVRFKGFSVYFERTGNVLICLQSKHKDSPLQNGLLYVPLQLVNKLD